MNMSEEFIKLQGLIHKEKLELRTKKSLYKNDIFGVWLYWYCKTKPSALNLCGNAYYIYFILTTDWLWLPLAIFIGFKFSWLYGLLIWLIHYIVQKKILSEIGQNLMIKDALINEVLFDDLWNNQAIGIMSVKKHESAIHKDGVPDLIIDPSNQNWREVIDKENLL